jgi:hypothetical protein
VSRKRTSYTLVALIARWIEALNHVRTGGRTTRTAAVRKAAAAPPRCPSCHQPMKHSTDWRDHLH